MDLGEHVTGFRFLVRDRASKLRPVRRAAAGKEMGGQVRRGRGRTLLPSASCLTVRPEYRPVLIFGERHLRRMLAEYAAHYNGQRPHQSLKLRPPRPDAPVPEPIRGRIRRRPILGGLINEYEAAA